ncbi:MAG: hypothetical protein IPM74_14670 [Crocinitomicaceae bacterium]|nr:hypothetical protein [Crocinitomicaceae bacterium]MBK8927114.1 hypothetical protein [Crocinitomicaceae bacterium]
MKITQYFTKNWEHKLFFIAVVAFACHFFKYVYFVTGDGPAHIYNSQLLTDLVFASHGELNQYYHLNNIPVPNWTGHFILSLLGLIFQAAWAEKIFLFLYFIGLLFSFRYFVRAFNPNAGIITLLILPFGMSVFLYSGFYNFSIAFVFMLFALGYFLRFNKKITVKNWLVLALLLLLVYFSHLAVLMACLLFMAVFHCRNLILDIIINKQAAVIPWLKRSFALCLTILPVMILVYWYSRIHIPGELYTYLPFENLVNMLLNGEHLVGHGAGEHPATRINVLLWVLLALIGVIFQILFFFRDKKKSPGLILLFLALISLIFYFILPDNDHRGGYISVRVLYLFYLLLVAWICTLPLSWKFALPAVITTAILLIIQLDIRGEGQRALSKWAQRLVEACDKIEPSSTVLPINTSNHWQARHLYGYGCFDKEVIFLANYETSHVYFPVRTIENSPLPVIRANDPSYACSHFFSQLNNTTSLPDYVLIYGFFENPINQSCGNCNTDSLLNEYTLISEDDFYRLLKFEE